MLYIYCVKLKTMQKILTTLLVLLSFYGQSQICTIDYTQTQTGIYPDTLPDGYVGQPYSTDVTFFMPLDTMGYDFTNFHIYSVSLPVGLSWQCNNAATNCDYNPQVSQLGCVNISGTPLLAGNYTIDVTVLADLTILSGYPFTFQINMEVLPNNVSVSNNGFSMVGAAGCSPITVDFTNNNPGELAYWWDFGNGNISTLENPVPQVYTTPGDYVVQYKAWDNLDTIDVYTLTGVGVSAMSNYGGGFPSFDNADAYFIIKENGSPIYQSTIIGDQNPPVSWTTSLVLNAANTYTITVYDADDSFGEVILGADDLMGTATMSLNGCNGCTAGTSTVNYTINHQIIYPNPIVISEDTIHVYGYPNDPVIAYDQPSHTLSTPDLGFAYQWYINGSPINNATNTSYLVTQSGVYHVIAINATGCVAFSDTMTAVYCNPAIVPTVSLGANGVLIAGSVPNGYTIQWLLSNFAISGQTNDTINAMMTGVYTVEIVDSFGCVHTSAPFNVNLGLTENSFISWNVYPNPADEYVTVEVSDDVTIETIQLVDLTGRVVKNWTWNSGSKMNLEINDVPNGYFIIQMFSGNQKWTKKLLIN